MLLSSVIGLERIQIDEPMHEDDHGSMEHTEEDFGEFDEGHDDEHIHDEEHYGHDEEQLDPEHVEETHEHTNEHDNEVSEHANEEDHGHTITEEDIENIVSEARHNVEGTLDVRHPLLRSKDQFSFTYFYRLAQIGHFMAHFYNVREGLIDFEDGNNYVKKNHREAENVRKAQDLVKVIRHHHEEIREELVTFFQNVENIEISVEELLNFLALENFFKRHLQMAEDAKEYEIIETVADNLQKIVYKFLGSMQAFFRAVAETYDIASFLKAKAEPFTVRIQVANRSDKLEKLEQGKSIIDSMVELQGHITNNIDTFKTGIKLYKSIRHELIDEISMLDATYRAAHGHNGNANIIIE